MLYESLAQPLIFLCMTAGGILSGVFFDIQKMLMFFLNQNKPFKKLNSFLKHIFIFFSVFSILFTFFYINLKVNYGQLRFFTVLAFALSLSIERFFVGSFLAKPIKTCYDKFKENKRTRHGRRKNRKQKSQT